MQGFKEFGYITEVSLDLLSTMNDTATQLAENALRHNYEVQKLKHFPNWEGEFKVMEGSTITHHSLARVDGEEISQEDLDKYVESLYDGPEFDLGDEYKLKPYDVKQFGWYAAVPEEFVISG